MATKLVGLGIFGPVETTLKVFQDEMLLVYNGVKSFDLQHLQNLDTLGNKFVLAFQDLQGKLNSLQSVHLPSAMSGLTTAVAAGSSGSIASTAKLIADIVAEIKYFVNCMVYITSIITTFIAIIGLIAMKIAELAAQLVLLATQAVTNFLNSLKNDLLKWLADIKKATLAEIQKTQGIAVINGLIKVIISSKQSINNRIAIIDTLPSSTDAENLAIKQADILLNQYINNYNNAIGALHEISDDALYGDSVSVTTILEASDLQIALDQLVYWELT